eukprot:TRINITY_DN4318_c0_g1_i2.p1 TRINITY_DN4318_c0_g1~~TRINITY_DN4318_c0_g1_i2.p1  ORF type:complete len:868 (+),score=67.70 TRINITY_DN4318_c0_g1_i2:81-2606(+)
MFACIKGLSVSAEWRIQKIRNIEGMVYGILTFWCLLQSVNNFVSGAREEGAILSAVAVVTSLGACLLRKSASRPWAHDVIEFLCWCLIVLGLFAVTCYSEDIIFRHRSLMFNLIFASVTPILLAMQFRIYVAFVGYNVLVNLAALWCITLLHGEEMPSRIYVFVVLGSAVFIMMCVLQHALLWKLYSAERELSFERQALTSLTSMTFDATCWLGNDKDTISACDRHFDGIMGESMKGSSFSALVPSEEDRSRLGRSLGQSHGNDSRFVPVTMLPITVATASGAPFRVEIYIVRYDVKRKEDSIDLLKTDRQFLLGIKMQPDSELPRKVEGSRCDDVLENVNENANFHLSPLKSRVNECIVKPSEDSCSLQSFATAQAPSMVSLPRTTATGRVFKSLNRPDAVNAKLSAMERLLKQEHWLIPSRHVKLCPDSILGKGGYGAVVKGLYNGAAVAVKLPVLTALNVQALKQSANELRILRHACHPNLVQFFGVVVDTECNTFALVLQLVHGVVLHKFAFAMYEAGMDERFRVITGIANALRHLHSQVPAIIHGDLKPSNVMVEGRMRSVCPKLLDFGLSRLRTLDAEPMGGTPRWMSPEVWLNGEVNPKSDVYSFGCLMHYVTTGQEPFENLTASDIEAHQKAGLPPKLKWPSHSIFAQTNKELVNKCVQPLRFRPNMDEISREVIKAWTRDLDVSSSHGDELRKCAEEARPWAEVVQLLYPTPGDQKAGTQTNKKKIKATQTNKLIRPLRNVTDRDAIMASIRDLMCHWNFEVSADCCCTFHGAVAVAQSVCSQLQRQQCSSDADPFDEYQCRGCGWLFSDESVAELTECYICLTPIVQSLRL